MTKAIIYLTRVVIALFATILFSGCVNGTNGHYAINFGNGISGSGTISNQIRNISEDFKSINVSDDIKVIVEQADQKSVAVEADDNLQQHIITKVQNGILFIESDENYNASKTPIVRVKLPTISGLSTSSGANISSKNTLITENIAVKSSSGSEINITVEADLIAVEASSGSTINVSGKALKLETSSSSGSNIDAENLMANDVIAQASSGSSSDVSPILSLKGKASSGSAIDYHKIPKSITIDESSGGSVSGK